MKNIITLLLLFVVTTAIQAQPKPAVKPGTPVVPGAPAKPKVSLYVLKKDYEEMLINMDAKVKSATNANAGLRNLIGRKDNEITALGDKMKQVEEILNSTAFKVSNTEDSLDKTRFSIEEFRKSTEEKFVANAALIEENKSNMLMMFGISIIVSIVLFVILLLQLGKLKKSMLSHNINAEIKLHETLADLTEKHKFAMDDLKSNLERDNRILSQNVSKAMAEEREKMTYEVEKLNAAIENIKLG
jgi:glutamine synthetase type III